MQTTLLHLTLESAPHPSLMLRQGRNSYYIMTRVFSTQIRARVGCGLVKTQPIILPKRKGLGIMIASFEEYGRFSFFLDDGHEVSVQINADDNSACTP